jgi:LPS sulfotransferase NodH
VNRHSLRVERAQERKLAQRRPIFVVFGGQRSGSTLVASRLNSHPHILCHEEVLLPSVDSEPSLREWLVANRHPSWFRMLPSIRESFLESVAESDPGPGIDVVGIKIMYDQISLWPKLSYLLPPVGRVCYDPRLLRWMRKNQVVIVHTLRRNHLKMLTSHSLAASTGRFHSRTAPQTATPSMISLPLRGLIMRLQRIESAEKVARDTIRGLPTMEVWYEDYVGTQGQEIEAQLCAAVGQQTPDAGLMSPLAKVNSDKLQDILANYDDVARHLSGTRFERFLD